MATCVDCKQDFERRPEFPLANLCNPCHLAFLKEAKARRDSGYYDNLKPKPYNSQELYAQQFPSSYDQLPTTKR
jgi:hypothetical protein